MVALALVAVLIFGSAYVEKSRNLVVAHAPYAVSAEARALHDSLTIGDLHAAPLLWKRDLTKPSTRGQVGLIEGNVTPQRGTISPFWPSASSGPCRPCPRSVNACSIRRKSCTAFRNNRADKRPHRIGQKIGKTAFSV